MTLPARSLLRAAHAANRSMADRTTPFMFNEWYVAAFSHEIDRTLRRRKILGRNVVLFRTVAGVPAALEDRCAHRSFPLSASRLDSDTIVCGYHGLRYDTMGNCIEVPSQPRCPKGIGVANYPLVERGPLVWIWMGAPELANPEKIPQLPWLEAADWERSHGYIALQASYVSLHENLMDLTHLSYLHAASFGTADYASAPYDVLIDEDVQAGQRPRFVLNRQVAPTRLPPVWAKPTGILGDTAARIASSEFISPALHVVTVRFHDTALPVGQRPEFEVRTAHIATPETLTSTHYFIVHGRDFARDDPHVTQFMHEQLFKAFAEDVAGLEAIERTLSEVGHDPYEISIATDQAAVAMRRYLKRRSDHEHGGQVEGEAQSSAVGAA